MFHFHIWLTGMRESLQNHVNKHSNAQSMTWLWTGLQFMECHIEPKQKVRSFILMRISKVHKVWSYYCILNRSLIATYKCYNMRIWDWNKQTAARWKECWRLYALILLYVKVLRWYLIEFRYIKHSRATPLLNRKLWKGENLLWIHSYWLLSDGTSASQQLISLSAWTVMVQ